MDPTWWLLYIILLFYWKQLDSVYIWPKSENHNFFFLIINYNNVKGLNPEKYQKVLVFFFLRNKHTQEREKWIVKLQNFYKKLNP